MYFERLYIYLPGRIGYALALLSLFEITDVAARADLKTDILQELERQRQVLAPLREYDCLFDGRKDRTEDYREVLTDRPWKNCPCSVCRQIGIDVVFFRGAERNRRRGFHNVFITYQRLHRELALLRREG